jgi:hypothetical protein
MLEGSCNYWNPWQDSLAAVGFGAAFRISGNQRARELAEALAMNVVRHGWLLTDKECQIATAMRWQDGTPFTAEQIAASDPKVILWAYNTGFAEWSVGALEIARVAAKAHGYDAVAERAAAIQARVRASRQRPGDGGIDRLTEWDAVRWEPQ